MSALQNGKTHTQAVVEILKAMSERLNGKPSNDIDTCPKLIDREFNGRYSRLWTCKDCEALFVGLVQGECPCHCKATQQTVCQTVESRMQKLLSGEQL